MFLFISFFRLLFSHMTLLISAMITWVRPISMIFKEDCFYFRATFISNHRTCTGPSFLKQWSAIKSGSKLMSAGFPT